MKINVGRDDDRPTRRNSRTSRDGRVRVFTACAAERRRRRTRRFRYGRLLKIDRRLRSAHRNRLRRVGELDGENSRADAERNLKSDGRIEHQEEAIVAGRRRHQHVVQLQQRPLHRAAIVVAPVRRMQDARDRRLRWVGVDGPRVVVRGETEISLNR